jgi:hypothetical protein
MYTYRVHVNNVYMRSRRRACDGLTKVGELPQHAERHHINPQLQSALYLAKDVRASNVLSPMLFRHYGDGFPRSFQLDGLEDLSTVS